MYACVEFFRTPMSTPPAMPAMPPPRPPANEKSEAWLTAATSTDCAALAPVELALMCAPSPTKAWVVELKISTETPPARPA